MSVRAPTIAVISSGLSHVLRGIETWAADTARVLHDTGHKVTLFKGSGEPLTDYERVCSCARRGGGLNEMLRKLLPGAAWRLGMGSAYNIEQTTFALNLIPKLGRRFDIVHMQDPLVALILQGARRTGLIKAPTILAHGTEEPFDFLMKIEFLQHLAPFHLEEAKAAGCWREGWTAIGNFVDTDHYRPGNSSALRAELGIAPDAFVVLSVAAVKRHHKRIGYLIEEVAALCRQTKANIFLVVAGAETNQTKELLALADERLGDRGKFLLNQPRQRMPEIFAAGDVFALCSLKEMMPIALLEAAASGLPCLVSTHPVVNWMIGPGGEGIPMQTEGVLASVLGRYLDAGLRRRTGEAARRHAVDNFSKESIIRQYLAMYENVLARSGQRNGA